jgi:predicted nuclease with TOPRIM domain
MSEMKLEEWVDGKKAELAAAQERGDEAIKAYNDLLQRTNSLADTVRKQKERIGELEDDRDLWKRSEASCTEQYNILLAERDEARAKLAEATTCGLCGTAPTDRNQLLICCENCTDIGASTVPKEVFELQRQLATERDKRHEALNEADRLQHELDKLKAKYQELHDRHLQLVESRDMETSELGAEIERLHIALNGVVALTKPYIVQIRDEAGMYAILDAYATEREAIEAAADTGNDYTAEVIDTGKPFGSRICYMKTGVKSGLYREYGSGGEGEEER